MILEYIVTEKDISIKQILKEKLLVSENLIIKLKKHNNIFINNIPVYISYKICTNDILTIDLDFNEESDTIIPNSNIKLDIIYEDEYILVVDKPENIPVHPSIAHFEDSLSNGVKYYFDLKNIHKKIRPVNRLDKDTSGLVIFAKSEYIQEFLVKEMKKGVFKKYYIAILEGKLNEKKGTISAPIARKSGSIIEREINENGSTAVSHYKVLKTSNKYSKVEFLLETGRTHQIRLHSKYIGFPIVGDFLYGTQKNGLNRHLLHAYKIELVHPISRQKVVLESELPEIFNKYIL